jgi:hypothetical protein
MAEPNADDREKASALGREERFDWGVNTTEKIARLLAAERESIAAALEARAEGEDERAKEATWLGGRGDAALRALEFRALAAWVREGRAG